MRRFFAFVAALVAAVSFALPARADDRPQLYYAQSVSAAEMNTLLRMQRNASGTKLSDMIGTLVSANGGMWSDLLITPAGGMSIVVSPATVNTWGSLYQIGASDPSAIGGSTQPFAADSTLITLHGQLQGTSPTLGPIAAPSSGHSEYVLVEAQVQVTSANPQSLTFQAANGTRTTSTVNRDVDDLIAFRLVVGATASNPTTPTIPSADAGWVPIGTVLVHDTTTSITSGLIALVQQTHFYGVAAVSTPMTTNSCVVASGSTSVTTSSAGCVQGVTASAPLASSGGLNPNLSLSGVVGTANGGTNNATFTANTCIRYDGTKFVSASGDCGLSSGFITTINGTSPIAATVSGSTATVSIGSPVTVALGGTGTANPTETAGTGLSKSGTWPNLTWSLSHGDYVDLGSTAQSKAGPFTAGSLTSGSGVNVGGPLTGATTVAAMQYHASSSSIVATSGTESYFGTDTSGVMHLLASGNSFLFRTGAGSTLAQINSTGVTTPGQFHAGTPGSNTTGFYMGTSNGASQETLLKADSTANVSGVTQTVLGVAITGVNNYLAVDGTGALGVLGAVKAGAGVAVGGALTGATTVNASGLATLGGGISLPINTTGTAIVNGTNIGEDGSGTLNFRVSNGAGVPVRFQNADGTTTYYTFGATSTTLPGSLAMSGALTGVTTLNASGLGTFAGVNAGGPLTGATTGAFSGLLSANGGLSATTGAFSGAIVTSYNSGPPPNPGSAAQLSWNGTGGSGDAAISTGFNGGVTASFWHNNGSAMVKSSQINSDGTYAAGTSQYGPTTFSFDGGVFSSDTSGNVTAASYNVSSRREWKKNITVLSDPLAMILDPGMRAFCWSYNGRGPTRNEPGSTPRHCGPMANNAPTVLSGPKHDHIDEGSLAGLTLAAVQQLAKQVDALMHDNRLLRDRLAQIEAARRVVQRVIHPVKRGTDRAQACIERWHREQEKKHPLTVDAINIEAVCGMPEVKR